MAASGARRVDISADQAVYIGEDRTIAIDVTDADGAAQAMTGWALSWYILDKPGGVALVTLTPSIGNGSGTDDRATITLADSDTEGIATKGGTYWHALARTDEGAEITIAEGLFVLGPRRIPA